MSDAGWRRWLGPLANGALTLLLAGLGYIAISHYGPEAARRAMEEAGPAAPLLFVLLKVATIVLAPLSGSPLYLVAGPLFGQVPGTLYLVAGDTIGGSVAFALSRRYGRTLLARVFGVGAAAAVDRAYARVGSWRALLLGRLLMPGLTDWISYAAGLTTMRYVPFLLISFFGGLPATYVAVSVGALFFENALLAIGIGLALAAIAGAVFVRLSPPRSEVR